MKKIRFGESAEAELLFAVRWYGQRSKTAAKDFRAAVRKGCRQIQRHPQAWEMWDPPFRHYLMRSFPFALVYLEEKQSIVILAVMHLNRKPDYWK
ncbi:MAG: type II toxin-antitoxin system RelE/ParE family toxin [Candidatus Sumerlaeaceae bacterium]